jgi:hypothetical protein
MPEISRFYGIIIYMFYNDHQPPHFHAKYQEFDILIEIETGIVKGQMPKRALKLIFDWLEEHKADLMINWQNSINREPLNKIQPLI